MLKWQTGTTFKPCSWGRRRVPPYLLGIHARRFPPNPSVTKFNTGAYKSSRSMAAFGVIVRDSGGSALLWHVGRILVSSAISVEAWALRIACLTALELNCSKAVFELDCLELINCFKDPKSLCPWEIRNWVFLWCCREKNKVAHWLASTSLRRNFVFQLVCILPGHEILLCNDVSR